MVVGAILAVLRRRRKNNVEAFDAVAAGEAAPPPQGQGALETRPSVEQLKAVETFLPFQQQFKDLYLSNVIQITVAVLIVTNFLVSMIKAELALHGVSPEAQQVFDVIEMFFIIVFTVELVINMYGCWFRPFFSNPWNIFDLFIVTISWLSKYSSALPGMSILRLFRAFRVFRLFKRMKELRKIISGILRSLGGVSQAFILLGLVMAIYSILGTEWFKDDFPIFYGTFFRSMISQFQIMTFDSWSSGIARPMCLELGAKWALFFITYVFINGIVMSQVVVAILLDTYLEPAPEPEAESKPEEEAKDEPAQEKLAASETSAFGQRKLGGAMSSRFLEAMEQAKLKRQIEENRKQIDELREQSGEEANKSSHHATNLKDGEEMILTQLDHLDVLTDRTISMNQRASKVRASVKGKVAEAKARESQKKGPIQHKLAAAYDNDTTQNCLAALIAVNFLVSIIETQVLPKPDSTGVAVFKVFEVVFTVIFTVELVFNAAGHWFLDFWMNAWNLFDTLVVGTSLLSLVTDKIPGIQVLRLFRAFRVFRLFKKIPELRKIMIGVLSSMPGVSNAFVLLGLIMSIWSVMGTEFFRDKYPEYYGNFFRSMLTMIQIMSFDSWCSGVTRTIVLAEGAHFGVYFITYVFATSIVMANVVVAILLDKYLSATSASDDGDGQLSEGEARVLEIQQKVLNKMRSIESALLVNGTKGKK